MRVLLIFGAPVRMSSSTSISNQNYIKGFVNNGYDVDVITQKVLESESNFDIFENEKVHYFEYETRSSIRKYFAKEKKALVQDKSLAHQPVSGDNKDSLVKSIKRRTISLIKYFLSKVNYDIDKLWVKNACHFRSDVPYDLVISSSYPVSSHSLAYELISKKHVQCNDWIQLWQDPWAHCLYAQKYSTKTRQRMEKQEKRLLEIADKVVYVSPLTMVNQKRFFPEFANKMQCVVLPSTDVELTKSINNSELKVGYFGEYFSYVRNIIPLYNALKELNISAQFVGDTDLCLEKEENISIHGRVPYSEIKKLENDVDVLVIVSNIAGGQIPGKVYYYASTNKIILYILDGTDEEQMLLYEYFSKYNRYIFSKNTTDDIKNKLSYIKTNLNKLRATEPSDAFTPKKIAKALIDICS